MRAPVLDPTNWLHARWISQVLFSLAGGGSMEITFSKRKLLITLLALIARVSTQPVCAYFQTTVAPFRWPIFIQNQTIVNAKANQPVLLSEGTMAGGRDVVGVEGVRATLRA